MSDLNSLPLQALPDGKAELRLVLRLRWEDIALLGHEAGRLAAQQQRPVSLDEAASHRLSTRPAPAAVAPAASAAPAAPAAARETPAKNPAEGRTESPSVVHAVRSPSDPLPRHALQQPAAVPLGLAAREVPPGGGRPWAEPATGHCGGKIRRAPAPTARCPCA